MTQLDPTELEEPMVERPIEQPTTTQHIGPPRPWVLLRRTMSYVAPYFGIVVFTFAFSALYTLGRNGRAYLLKPLLDDAINLIHGHSISPDQES